MLHRTIQALRIFEMWNTANRRKALRFSALRLLMLVTALNPNIGYEAAARTALKAHREGLSLCEAALALVVTSTEQFDEWVKPDDMTAPLRSDS